MKCPFLKTVAFYVTIDGDLNNVKLHPSKNAEYSKEEFRECIGKKCPAYRQNPPMVPGDDRKEWCARIDKDE